MSPFPDAALVSENDKQRERLSTITAGLTNADLKRDLGWGWTVAVALAHLAFYDRRALIVLERWDGKGLSPPEGDVDILNDSLVAEWLTLPPRKTIEMATTAAAAIDDYVRQLDPGKASSIIAGGEDWLLRRSSHRQEHLDQIEQALRRS